MLIKRDPPMKAVFIYKGPPATTPVYADLWSGEFFRQARPVNPKHPCPYIKTGAGAVSLRSGAICAIEDETPVVRLKAVVEYEDK